MLHEETPNVAVPYPTGHATHVVAEVAPNADDAVPAGQAYLMPPTQNNQPKELVVHANDNRPIFHT